MRCPLQIAELDLSLMEMRDIIEKRASKVSGSTVIYDVYFIDVARDLKDYFLRKLNYNLHKKGEFKSHAYKSPFYL